jgi:hypothetical protein
MSITARVTNSPTVSAKITPQDRVLVTNYRINASALRIGDIFDVNASAASDGAHLVYNGTSQTWVATTNIDNVNTIISGGNF